MSIKKTSKKDLAVCLNSYVIFEKCSKKNFIYNSERYLNSIGIRIFIWEETIESYTGIKMSYASTNVSKSLKNLIEIYGMDCLYDFYKLITSNDNLRHLPHCQNLLSNLGKGATLPNDGYHSKYYRNSIEDKYGVCRSFLLYCTTKNILKSAGYNERKSTDII
jgi:hypothetical protein